MSTPGQNHSLSTEPVRVDRAITTISPARPWKACAGPVMSKTHEPGNAAPRQHRSTGYVRRSLRMSLRKPGATGLDRQRVRASARQSVADPGHHLAIERS